jgi:predicted RecB family nuclease
VQLRNGKLLFSPSDLSAFVACAHLTQLELAVARGLLEQPDAENPHADLVKRKGDAHELAYLEQFRAEGRDVVAIELGDEGRWDLERAARETEEAMRAGADVVYQGVLLGDGWRGLADFLERVETPSDLGEWSYEVADTKLARRAKPAHVLQLCFYSEQVGRIQGRLPERMHVVAGTGARESFRVEEFLAFYRRVRARFEAAVAAGIDPYPLPVDHCSICEFLPRCEARWIGDDHLTLVARLRRDQAKRLEEQGVPTLAALAEAPNEARPAQMHPQTFEALRDQAAMQLAVRRTGVHDRKLLPLEPGRGYALLPPSSPGDLFFDIEGDPFWTAARGLEYLWGIVELEGGEPRFRAYWAHDRAEERNAVEDVIDLIRERLERDPALHVYHYAPYEVSALKRLCSEYGTREEELDDLLRRKVFVDLYRVVAQALRISHDGYGLKKVETFYMEREAELRAGDDSILLYEDWLESRDDSILRAIAEYNEEDCVSTWRLRDWLLGLRPAEAAWLEPGEPGQPPEGAAETETLRLRLLEGLPEDPLRLSEAERPRWLAAQLLGYHRREAKPVWWWFFDRLGRSAEELMERDGDSIGGIEPAGPPSGSGKALVYPFTYQAQQHRLDTGDSVNDPQTGAWAGTIESLDDAEVRLELRRGPKLEDVPLPHSLIPGGPYNTDVQQAALHRFARSLLDGDGRYPALERILAREPFGAPLAQDDVEAAKELVRGLDGGYLVVQGPPGSGKTYRAARLIVDLIGRGRRVGVTALSHKAIHNVLREVEKVARAEGVEFRGLKKGDEYSDAFVETSGDQSRFSQPEDDVLVLAGTSWLFAREDMGGVVDTLFVDEAGQVSLADALAAGTCARNVVLLGDPQQLPQVSQGTHPEGSGASVLEHLLGGEDTIPPDRGLFLGVTYRLHPEICAFVSELSYEGRLHSDPSCARRRVEPGGIGLRWLPVEHEGNRGSSREEAGAIRAEVQRLVGGTFTDEAGRTRRLGWNDILVVAPYNAQVRCLREALGTLARVGTVDKFQGQQAPVVFFSMATSSGDELPRNLEFLFSRNRLNVAISRAQCLAVLVCSPWLLEVDCRTIEQMRMVNGLCSFVDLAVRSTAAA